MKRIFYLISILTIFLTACNTKPTSYSLQIYGDISINGDTSKVQTVMNTDRSLDTCYYNWRIYPSVSESYSLNKWVDKDILNEIELKYANWGVTWYNIKINGFVRDPKSDQVFMINKRYISN